MSIVLQGSTSGSITLQEPAIAGSTTINLPATSGTALVAPTALTVPNTTGTVMVSGNMPAFSAYQGTNQSIPTASQTKVTIDVEEFDTNNNFASSRFTPTVAGYYQINGSVQTNGSQQYLSVSIFKNGTIYKYGGFGTTMYQSAVSSLVYLNGSTDYVELYTYGASGFTSQNGIQATYFNGAMVRAA